MHARERVPRTRLLIMRRFPEIDQGEGLLVGSRSRLQPLKRLVDVAR